VPEHLLTALSAVRIAGAALAVFLVVQAYKAWRKSRDPRMFKLGLGFALLMLSVLVEGAVFQLLVPGNLQVAHLVESATQVAAFSVLIWALY